MLGVAIGQPTCAGSRTAIENFVGCFAMFFHRRRRVRRSGCSLLVVATLVTCMLLVCNRILAASLYRVAVPTDFDFPRVRTVVSMLAMVGLLLPEWWLIDWTAARFKAVYHWIESPRSGADL
jgi:riboflavin transporter FmnP